MSSIVSTTSTTMAPRRRMHSWSRLRRSPEEKAKLRAVQMSSEHFDDTEHTVEDMTQICFARDGEWFQGNINPPHHCVYQIHGRRISPSNNNSESSPATPLPSSCSSSCTSDDASMDSSSRSSSCSIDSEAVQEALQKLSEEEDDASSSNQQEPELYRVLVSDMETGLSYRLEEVSVFRSEDSCSIVSEQLQFKAESLIRGRRANTILLGQFGPSFTAQALALFEGPVSFKYTDKIYRPAHASERMLEMTEGAKTWL